MKLAIITCKKLPQGVEDDQSLFQAIRDKDIKLTIVPWNEKIDWSQYDACLLRSVWDYHEQVEAFTNWLIETSQVTQIINSQEVILWNQNKHYLQEFQQFGITIAPTTWISKNDTFDLSQWCQQHPNDGYFLKPVIGADSSGTLRFKNSSVEIENAQSHLDQWLQHFDMMLQPYLSHVETFGETSIIFIDGNYAHAVRKIPVKGDYRVQDTFGAADIAYTPDPAEMALSKACTQFLESRFEQVVYARYDFLHDEDGNVYLNEAELFEPSLFFAHGPNTPELMAAAIYQKLSRIQSAADSPESD